MVVFSSDPKEGYLTKQGIRDIKSAFATRVFEQDLLHTYEHKTEYRNALGKSAQARMAELVSSMNSGSAVNERLEQLIGELAEKLKATKGKKVYGYLPPRVKSVVDEIMDELAKDERIAAAYSLWQDMQDEVVRTYTDDLPERKPLSQQKEFKPVRNMVIRETLKLSERKVTFEDEGMDDEPESAETVPPTTSGIHKIYEQAERYHRCPDDAGVIRHLRHGLAEIRDLPVLIPQPVVAVALNAGAVRDVVQIIFALIHGVYELLPYLVDEL